MGSQEYSQKTSFKVVCFDLGGNLLRRIMTTCAFLMTPNCVPARLRTSRLALSILTKVSQIPVIKFLASSQALIFTPVIISCVQIARWRITSKTIAYKGYLEKIGHLISALAFFNLARVSFGNIGTWGKIAGSILFFGVFSGIGGLFYETLRKKDVPSSDKSLSQSPLLPVVAIGYSLATSIMLGKIFPRLSWLPQAELRIITVGLGTFSVLYSLNRITESKT